MAAERTYVFLGPTLPLGEARALLPGARFCPPVRCGDVLGLLRQRPAPLRIAIIDGVFEQVGAVWHKEILQALAGGVHVFGASSMGALRAAELWDLGMIGVGAIFDGYRDGRLVDDGDVALLHGPAALGHAPLTDALVNIEATLRRARGEGVIDEATAAAIARRARATFYQRRVLADLLDEEAAIGADRAAPIAALRGWLARPGADAPRAFVDQKRLDAVALLRRLAGEDTGRPAARPPAPVPTVFLRGLQAHIACRPLAFDADWLPEEERLLRHARLLGPRYRLLRTLALALSFVDADARRRGATLLEAMEGAEDSSQEDVVHLARLFGVFAPTALDGSADADDDAAAACGLLARAWGLLAQLLAARGVLRPPAEPEILAHAADLQRRLGLDTQPSLDAWLAGRGLSDRRAYAAFLAYTGPLERLLRPQAINLYGFFAIDAEERWLHVALTVSGQAERLARRLADPARFAREIGAAWRALPAPEREVLAADCDFPDHAEVEQALDQLNQRAWGP